MAISYSHIDHDLIMMVAILRIPCLHGTALVPKQKTLITDLLYLWNFPQINFLLSGIGMGLTERFF